MSNDSSLKLPPFPSSYRASGLLLHVTSLPSPYGIGDVGPAGIAWIDQLCDAGQSWWQALPLGPTGYGNSPYQSLSSFAGNGLLISPDWLIEDGLLRPSDCVAPSFSPSAVDYNTVIPFKHRLLEKAWTNFVRAGSAELRVAFEQFCHEQAHWLEDPKAPDVLYIKALAAPFTVNTMPEGTLKALADHGDLSEVMSADGGDCEAVLDQFAAAGIDIDDLGAKLQDEGAKSFVSSWNDLMEVIASKSASLAKAG